MARIIIVHDIAGVAAIEAELLRAAGHDVTHIRPAQPGAGWRWPIKGVALLARLFLYIPVALQIRRERPDVVHIHWVLMGLIGVLSGRPFFLTAHGSDLHSHFRSPLLRWLSRLVLARATRVFYTTPNLAAFLTGFEAKSVELPNPVDPSTFPIAAREPAREVLLFTRLDPVKGVDIVYGAVDELASDTRLTGLDWGPLRSRYVPLYQGRVTFVTPVPRDRIPDFLSRFDVIVGQMNQGTVGLAEVEALAAGCPVVTGIDRSLYPDDPPPVTPAGSPAAIVGAVRGLLDDPLRARAARDAGRAWVDRHHGYANHVARLEREFGVSQEAGPIPDPRP